MQPPLAYNQIVADVQPPPPSYDQITAARLCGMPSGCHVGDSSVPQQTLVDGASPTKVLGATMTVPSLRAVGSSVERVAPLLDPRLTCPLTVDTSVEYEMPASACPPKNCEPLLMVHPQYFEFQRHRRLQGGWCRCQLCCFYGRGSSSSAETANGVDLSAGAVFRQSASMLLKSSTSSSSSASGRVQKPEFKVPKEPAAARHRSVAASGTLRQSCQLPQQQHHQQQPRPSGVSSYQSFRQPQRGTDTFVAQSANLPYQQNSGINPNSGLTQYTATARAPQMTVQNSGFALENGSMSGNFMTMHPVQSVQNSGTQSCQCAACVSSSAASKVRYQLPVVSAASATTSFSVCDSGGRRKRAYSTVFPGDGANSAAEKTVSPLQWSGGISSGRCAKRTRLCSEYSRSHLDSQFCLPNFAVI